MDIDIGPRLKAIKKVLSLPPYNYIVEFLYRLKDKEYDKEKYSEKDIFLMKTLLDTFSRDLNRDINQKLRLIEIENDLIKLVENTDNKIFYRKLFFPSVFINNEFEFENWIIKGILVEEVFTNIDSNVHISTRDVYPDSFNDYIIFISAIKPNTLTYWNMSFSLIKKDPVSLIDTIKEDKDNSQKRRIEEYIRNIICNMVDMVDGNDKDLNIITIESSKEQNLKRIKRGKIPFPTKIFIRAKGEFKKYVQRFNVDALTFNSIRLGHKFLVRGHWRHFRDERYVNKMGQKTWIKPFWKGEGIVVAKEYKLIER